jgi:hypothetical protein
MSAISFIDSCPDNDRARWVKAFKTVVAELSTALAKGRTIFQLSCKQIETPEGQIPYAEVLMYFEDSSNEDYRQTASRLWRQLAAEYFAMRKALEKLDTSEMARA